MSDLAAMKAEHDRLWREGNEALEIMQRRFKQVMDLRAQIEQIEGDEYDPIWMLFNGTFSEDDQ
jgi:hypothetical protein